MSINPLITPYYSQRLFLIQNIDENLAYSENYLHANMKELSLSSHLFYIHLR